MDDPRGRVQAGSGICLGTAKRWGAAAKTQGGFTLIELLVVISILAMLTAMLMPLLAMAKRTANASATRSVMAKVDTALRLFRADIGSYPWQRSYADPLASANWTNRLYWHLGSEMSDDQLQNLRDDAETAAAHYASPSLANTFSFVANNSLNQSPGIDDGKVMMLNRMAAERARRTIYSGNIDAIGPQPRSYVDPSTLLVVTPRALATDKLVPAPPACGVKPGWAADYLAGEIERRYVIDESIVDAWKLPLLYVCQVVEGVHSAPSLITTCTIPAVDFGLQPLGRTTLGEKDAILGAVLVAHATRLPDVANLRHSDRRYYAAPGLEVEFELWSAGPDGRADWMRDALSNNDNVPLLPYDKRIP